MGETRCRRFGAGWARSAHNRVRISLAAGTRGLSLAPLMALEGGAGKAPQRGGADVWAGGATLRVEWLLWAYATLAVEVGLHVAPVRGSVATPGGDRDVDRLRTTDPGVAVGVEGPLFGLAGLGAELYVGARSMWLVHQLGDSRDIVGRALSAVIEPRITFRVFVARHLSVGLRFGTNVLAPGEVHAALTLTAHVRRFDAHPHR